MNRLTIFSTGVALIGVWLYLSLSIQSNSSKRRSLSKITSDYIPPEESKLKGCFPWSVYYLQSLEFKDGSVVCRGNLRKAPDVAYKLIRDNISETFGDRFLVLFQELPRDRYADRSEETLEATKYVFVITSNFTQFNLKNSQTSTRQISFLEWLKWLGSAIAGTLLLLVLAEFWLDSGDFKVLEVVQIVVTLAIILTVRELVRRWVANRYGIKVSLPYFTPHLGGIIWHKSHIPHRRALFDLAIAPNLVSLLIGLILVVVGMLQPVLDPLTNGIEFDFKVSLLMSGLVRVLSNLPNLNGQLHPLAYAGWWCLNLTALSLIPVSILDGAYILRTTIGRNIAIAAPIARITVLGLGLISQQWLILVAIELFLLDYAQAPPLNDVTELNLARDILGIGILALGLIAILPAPRFLF